RMTHAHLDLEFPSISMPDDKLGPLWNDLVEKAPSVVVEVIAEHLNGLLEQQQQALQQQRQQQRDLLQREHDDLQVSIEKIQGTSYEVGSSALRAHIEELAKRLRDDAIRL